MKSKPEKNERRETQRRLVRYLRSSAFVCGCLVFAAGCVDNKASTQPSTGDAMLNDPMGYKADTGKVDISGGPIGHYDKNAMKKDMDHVFNP